MPTYEFRCKSGHDFEQFHRTMSSAPTEVPCPQCGETAERRISGGAGLMFKGSGFYITDYGKDGKKAQRSSSGSGEAGGASGGEAKSSDTGGKTESKAEAKSEAKSESKSESKPAAKPSSSGGE
jgi:putative FmdB family regulatory protein